MLGMKRLGPGDEEIATDLFLMMGEVFEEERERLAAPRVAELLRRTDFWALAALEDGVPVGGVTGFTLPLTRKNAVELFIYDLAVRADRQRQGIGRRLMATLLDLAAAEDINVAFVPADDEDKGAIEFYRSLCPRYGGEEAPVTIFSFTRPELLRPNPARVVGR